MYSTPPDLLAGFKAGVLLLSGERSGAWKGMEGKEKDERGREGKAEGKGSLERGNKGRKGKGDKSPAWSSQYLGSTAILFAIFHLELDAHTYNMAVSGNCIIIATMYSHYVSK